MRGNMAGVFLPNSNKFCALYKKKGSPWKETRRIQCMERLKCARNAIVNRFRQLSITPSENIPSSAFQSSPVNAPQVMKEWRTLFELNLPTLTDDDYEENDHFEQKLRAQEVEELEMRYIEWLMSDSVTCPICQVQSLIESPKGVACSCGFQLQTELNMQQLGENLDRILTSHKFSCSGQPRFESPSENLVIFCQECHFNAEIA